MNTTTEQINKILEDMFKAISVGKLDLQILRLELEKLILLAKLEGLEEFKS